MGRADGVGLSCYHLKPRDAYVGWTNSIRAERLKLVVNNRRFTILSEPGERRNLASECLGLVARELPRLWLEQFHYRPLLAETFCDIERTAGTCYKAAGRIPLARRATSPSTTRSATCTTRGTATGPSPSGDARHRLHGDDERGELGQGEKLAGWMASQGDGTLPRQLALDGKFVKEVMGVVSVVNAETGARLKMR